VLYELVVGRTVRPIPSARPADMQSLLREIADAPSPPLPPGVPEELAAIIRCALARRTEDRFADALALRDALASYRAHRESVRVAREAQGRLAQAVSGLEYGGAMAIDAGRNLSAARFGFEQALRSWPDNPAAELGRRECVVRMAERELSLGRMDAAQALVDEMTWATVAERRDIQDRVDGLRRKQAADRRRLVALEAAAWDADLGEGARARRVFGIAIAAALLGVNVLAGWLDRSGAATVDHPLYLIMTSAVAMLFAVPALLLRAHLFPNAVNQRLIWSIGLMLMAEVVVFAALWRYGVPIRPTLAISVAQLAGTIAVKTVLMERRAMWTAAVALAAAGGIAAVPDAAFEFVGVAYAVYFLGGGLLRFDRPTSAEASASGRPGSPSGRS
jgi:hypothetical protein